jgi:hypothetical protein
MSDFTIKNYMIGLWFVRMPLPQQCHMSIPTQNSKISHTNFYGSYFINLSKLIINGETDETLQIIIKL